MQTTISGQDCFAIWAPDGVLWSQWAKPVPFAHAPALFTDPPAVVPENLPALPRPWDHSAIVVDLPGEQSVLVGLALAQQGFRPVPLFNGTSGPMQIVPMDGIERALGAGADVLKRVLIAPEAKPAFLLDSERHTPIGGGEPGRYDNRWIVLPQDFPSATLLLANGIKDVLVIRQRDQWVEQDLTHVLLRWQQAGLRIRAVELESGETHDNLQLTIPSNFRKLWYGVIALMGLRRNNAGGFGSLVPEQTQHSGYYG
jgi:hypothetical protein